ncbi:ABC-type multidrug transport system, permease component [Corynebacterium deserti GIMN1.010]|uniref:ABC-type multidrug transport system, permease component n=1 Tax=Corynebacterium deserti GIMN1.010 TaxID=931089 RepID=A0A0M4CZU1_9CORY|nr:multidrug ABC transporter permease [Corynebacterium deserti]ALC06820.1 ABC-type multidrug transport system, permease component [Corynebacterium deserti GIMN1.010]
MINTLRSEWTKLTTTKSFWWTTALFLIISLGFAAMTGSLATGDSMASLFLFAGNTVTGLYLLGFVVLMIQATMIFTTEFRYGYQSQTFLATPKRWVVALAKWLLYVVLAAALTFVTVLLCFYLAKALASDVASSTLVVWEDKQALAIMWKYPVAAALMVTLCSGVALLVRQTAGAVSLVLMWHFALENLLSFLPKVGESVGKYGPFTNLRSFITEYQTIDPGWSTNTGAVYFAAWAVVLFVAGIIVQERRDA